MSATWDHVRHDWYHARGYGSVSKRKLGWYGSASAYPDERTDVRPVVGPFTTARKAMAAFERALAREHMPTEPSRAAAPEGESK